MHTQPHTQKDTHIHTHADENLKTCSHFGARLLRLVRESSHCPIRSGQQSSPVPPLRAAFMEAQRNTPLRCNSAETTKRSAATPLGRLDPKCCKIVNNSVPQSKGSSSHMTMQTPRKSLSAILDNASDCGVTNESILRDTTPRKQSTNAFLQFDDDSMTPPPVAQRTEQPAEVNFTEDKQALLFCDVCNTKEWWLLSCPACKHSREMEIAGDDEEEFTTTCYRCRDTFTFTAKVRAFLKVMVELKYADAGNCAGLSVPPADEDCHICKTHWTQLKCRCRQRLKTQELDTSEQVFDQNVCHKCAAISDAHNP